MIQNKALKLNEFVELPISSIIIPKKQRKRYDTSMLEASMEEYGQLQPILCRRIIHPGTSEVEIVLEDGFHRLLVWKKLGNEKIKAQLEDIPDPEIAEKLRSEPNLVRAELTTMEKCSAIAERSEKYARENSAIIAGFGSDRSRQLYASIGRKLNEQWYSEAPRELGKPIFEAMNEFGGPFDSIVELDRLTKIKDETLRLKIVNSILAGNSENVEAAKNKLDVSKQSIPQSLDSPESANLRSLERTAAEHKQEKEASVEANTNESELGQQQPEIPPEIFKEQIVTHQNVQDSRSGLLKHLNEKSGSDEKSSPSWQRFQFTKQLQGIEVLLFINVKTDAKLAECDFEIELTPAV